MASNPGLFTEWPWQRLGNLKYLLLAPLVAQSVHCYKNKWEGNIDMFNLLIIPMQLVRVVHSQLWISWARFQTARSKHRIVHKGLEFDQVDRERNWDDQILLSAILAYMGNMFLPGASHIPWWDTRGAIITALLHAGPVEFLYYWFHRALHHHYLYSRYHSHHHASIVTEPITSVIHPFGEEVIYFVLFAMPLLITVFTGTVSTGVFMGYLLYIDLMNYMGHCNFELVPKWLFRVFPPLKYLMYTPSFHSLHHTQFRTNYSLFMPFYDYIYGTMDKTTEELYESSLKGKEETPEAVHLTHPTSSQSIYHLRLGFASLASKPYASKWYMWAMWPVTCCSLLLTRMCGSSFTVDRNRLKGIDLQTWAIPRFSFQYMLSWERDAINHLIEETILEAEGKGIKVLSLGLLNQEEEMNKNGELYLLKHPKLKIRVVDGSGLAAAVVLRSIPQETKQVLLIGKASKVAYVVARSLCQRGVQVITAKRDEFERMKLRLPTNLSTHLVLSEDYTPKVWVVGEGLTDKEQRRAVRGTRFIPFSQFPPKKQRSDCVYHSTPAMVVPKEFENMHACENWLPRRVMSAWRAAGIVHALEKREAHEVGDVVLDVDEAWRAALAHGFLPLPPPKV